MINSRQAIAIALVACSVPLATARAQTSAKPINRANFTATLDAQFKAIDANKDGVASVAEIEAYQRAQAALLIQRQTAGLFARLDTNRDGSISREEFLRISSSTNVKVSAAPMLAKMDTNKDGKISLAEFRAATQANFAKIDTNHDGVVSPEEIRAAQQQR